jgi:hypothetical protein
MLISNNQDELAYQLLWFACIGYGSASVPCTLLPVLNNSSLSSPLRVCLCRQWSVVRRGIPGYIAQKIDKANNCAATSCQDLRDLCLQSSEGSGMLPGDLKLFTPKKHPPEDQNGYLEGCPEAPGRLACGLSNPGRD